MTAYNPEKHYQGDPCERGHSGMRYRSNESCVECIRMKAKQWREKNAERQLEQKREYRRNNREKVREHDKRHYYRNLEQERERGRDYYRRTSEIQRANRKRNYWSDPERHREKARQWSKNNKGRANETTAKYQAAKRQATPTWYEKGLCSAVYEKASELGSSVDHVVPLRSDIVCGLHCWDNLQVLPVDLNVSKGNQEWPNMPEET